MAVVPSATTLQKGAEAPEFRLQSTSGETVSLSQVSGKKATVVIFMCNHCPFVKFKLPRIVELFNAYESQGVSFIGINSNDASKYLEDSFEAMQELHLPFPYLHDESQAVAHTYGATCTPDAFVFDKKLLLVYHGRFDNALNPGDRITSKEFENVLDAVIEDKEWDKWFVPSLGCSIKWR